MVIIHLIRDGGRSGLFPRLGQTRDFKTGSYGVQLGVRLHTLYGKHNDRSAPCLYNVKEWVVTSRARVWQFQCSNTVKGVSSYWDPCYKRELLQLDL